MSTEAALVLPELMRQELKAYKDSRDEFRRALKADRNVKEAFDQLKMTAEVFANTALLYVEIEGMQL